MRQLIWVRGNWKCQTFDLMLLSKYKREPGAWNKHVPFQGNNHNSTSDFYKNLLLFVIINLKIPTCRWFLILQLSPWVLHKQHSQARGGWSPIFFLLPFSIFPSFSSFFQVSRLLPAYNLNLWKKKKVTSISGYCFFSNHLVKIDPCTMRTAMAQFWLSTLEAFGHWWTVLLSILRVKRSLSCNRA